MTAYDLTYNNLALLNELGVFAGEGRNIVLRIENSVVQLMKKMTQTFKNQGQTHL